MSIASVRQMHSLLPSLRLIGLVREPVARAYSGFQHTCNKGRVFRIAHDITQSTSKSSARALLRRTLAGHVIIAENVSQAVEGLYIRFGRAAVFETHLRKIEYPCSPESFDDFLMLSGLESSTASAHLTEEAAESLLDVRSPELSSILAHGLYHQALERYLSFYTRDQVLIMFTEELKTDAFGSLDRIQDFLGIPRINFEPFAYRNSRGATAATYMRSKTMSSAYSPMSDRARSALAGFFDEPNANLASLLQDDRVTRYWSKVPR